MPLSADYPASHRGSVLAKRRPYGADVRRVHRPVTIMRGHSARRCSTTVLPLRHHSLLWKVDAVVAAILSYGFLRLLVDADSDRQELRLAALGLGEHPGELLSVEIAADQDLPVGI